MGVAGIHSPPGIDVSPRRARFAVSAVFAAHGAVAGTFATRVPWIKDHLHLGPAALGIALVAPAIGSFITMPLAGGIAHRYGARAAITGSAVLFCASLALPALAPSLPFLFAALFLYGAAAGVTDVMMNANGVEVEHRMERSIMSGLHGTWSAGALAGSGAGALAARFAVDARVHLGAAAAVLIVLCVVCGRSLLDVRSPPAAAAPPGFALPVRGVLLIGLVGFCATFAEGGAMNWCAVYLKDTAGASAAVAAVSFTGFAATMALMRLAGDVVIGRFGVVRTVAVTGSVAVVGGVLVVAARGAGVAIAGFALLGIGIAVVVPLTFRAAGRHGQNPNQSIAGVATITYASNLIAPAAVGALAGATSLRVSFALITVLVAFMAAGAGVLRAPSAPAAPGAFIRKERRSNR